MFNIFDPHYRSNGHDRLRSAERAIFYSMLILSVGLANDASAADSYPAAGMYTGEAVLQSVRYCSAEYKVGQTFPVQFEYPGALARKWRIRQIGPANTLDELEIGKQVLTLNPESTATSASGTLGDVAYSQSNGVAAGLSGTWQAHLGIFDNYSFTMQLSETYEPPSVSACTVTMSIALVWSGGLLPTG